MRSSLAIDAQMAHRDNDVAECRWRPRVCSGGGGGGGGGGVFASAHPPIQWTTRNDSARFRIDAAQTYWIRVRTMRFFR